MACGIGSRCLNPRAWPLAIPHNYNASKGIMFGSDGDSNGKPYDAAYAERRSRMEPLIEMMQVKGNSEVHRSFWQADEFADFENADSMQQYSGRVAQGIEDIDAPLFNQGEGYHPGRIPRSGNVSGPLNRT